MCGWGAGPTTRAAGEGEGGAPGVGGRIAWMGGEALQRARQARDDGRAPGVSGGLVWMGQGCGAEAPEVDRKGLP
eukprot:133432-Chlamydomonas_euryale.AAC.1